MIYFVAYYDDRVDKWYVKMGTAHVVRYRLNTHARLLPGAMLLGCAPGSYSWETDIMGRFAYLTSGQHPERFKMHPDLLKWIYENTSLDYPVEITGAIARFNWGVFEDGQEASLDAPDKRSRSKRMIDADRQ